MLFILNLKYNYKNDKSKTYHLKKFIPLVVGMAKDAGAYPCHNSLEIAFVVLLAFLQRLLSVMG